MVLDFDSKFQKVKWLVINHSYKSALVYLVKSYKLQEKFKRYISLSEWYMKKISTMKTTQQPLNARGFSE